MLDARVDIIDELTHNLETAKKYTEATDLQVILARIDALHASYAEFIENKKEMSMCVGKFDDETRKSIRKTNNTILDEYVLVKALLQSLIPDEEKEKSFIHNSSTTQNNSEKHVRIQKTNFKLPPIQIKPFKGNYEEWEEFRDIFEACFCSENEKFTDCQKLLYLKGSVQGEPYDLIRNLKATNTNFSAAWELLDNRYQNTKKIFKAHLNAILNISPMQHETAAGPEA